jgi:hypothetical protein
MGVMPGSTTSSLSRKRANSSLPRSWNGMPTPAVGALAADPGRVEGGRRVLDRQVAAGRQGGEEAGDDRLRVIGVREEVQDAAQRGGLHQMGEKPQVA